METSQRRGGSDGRDWEDCPRLTLEQACRLWQMNDAACEAILQTLVAEGFLARTTDGAFVAMPAPNTTRKAALVPIRQQATGS